MDQKKLPSSSTTYNVTCVSLKAPGAPCHAVMRHLAKSLCKYSTASFKKVVLYLEPQEAFSFQKDWNKLFNFADICPEIPTILTSPPAGWNTSLSTVFSYIDVATIILSFLPASLLFKLRIVCRRWRTIISRVPAHWKSTDGKFNQVIATHLPNIISFEGYIPSHCSDLGLPQLISLSVPFLDHYDKYHQLTHLRVGQSVQQSQLTVFTNLKSLDLSHGIYSNISLCPFVQLEQLEICDHELNNSEMLALNMLPKLTRLGNVCLSPSLSNLPPWLKELRVFGSRQEYEYYWYEAQLGLLCLSLVTQLRTLVVERASNLSFSHLTHITDLKYAKSILLEGFLLTQLRSLIFSKVKFPGDISWLQRASFPHLQILCFSEMQLELNPNLFLGSLCSRAPQLRVLKWTCVDLDGMQPVPISSPLLTCISSSTNLTKLTLTQMKASQVDFLSQLMRRLSGLRNLYRLKIPDFGLDEAAMQKLCFVTQLRYLQVRSFQQAYQIQLIAKEKAPDLHITLSERSGSYPGTRDEYDLLNM